jgi:hypothetical protein
MTTQKTDTWASWRWANPLWWAERQLEATRFAVHVTAAMFDASRSSASSPLPQVHLEASTYSPSAQQTAAALTAVVTVAPLERQLEAPEPHRELQPAVPQADLQPAIPETDLERLTTQADLDLVGADLDRVTAGADLEAVVLDAEPATAGPGEAVHEADTVPSAPVPGWDELTLGSIRARLRRLSPDDLTALQSYEKAHGARPDVLSMLENRLVKIRSAQPGS